MEDHAIIAQQLWQIALLVQLVMYVLDALVYLNKYYKFKSYNTNILDPYPYLSANLTTCLLNCSLDYSCILI